MTTPPPGSIPAPLVMRNLKDMTDACGKIEDDLFNLWSEILGTSARMGFRSLSGLEAKHRKILERVRDIREKGISGRVDGFIDDDDPDAMQKIAEFLQNPALREFRSERIADLTALSSDVSQALEALKNSVGLARSTTISLIAIALAGAAIVTGLISTSS